MILIQKEWYSVQQCRENPETLYIFGDNTKRYGKAGQAIIRDEPNSFGISTKLLPSMTEDSFFRDCEEHLKFLDFDLDMLGREQARWKNIVFPYDGLGTGLSDLPNKAPLLYRIMKDKIFERFEVNYK